MSPDQAGEIARILREDAAHCYDHYLMMLNETADGQIIDESKTGLARELARINLPVGIYTQFYWKVNLWNLLRFLSLRADAHAQYEIRAYADAILGIVEKWVPYAYEAFADYVLGASELSAQGLALVRAALSASGKLDPQAYGLSGRELRELIDVVPELSDRLVSP
jgi:thymidylate synthase (FAD)